MTLNWNKLRADDNINKNFEELCCQLAKYEDVPSDSKFIRKGTPDAGVECYWIFPNNHEWGWQAKWFLTSPNPSQWKQIDDSVKKALEKHPNLTKYVICLPVDRSDSRISGRNSFLDKWDEHVKTWKQIKDITFEYWGTFEIENRLSEEQHFGRCKYFFDQEFLSYNWFERHLKQKTAAAGLRYSPKLNVHLPLAEQFDVLGRTSEFFDHMKKTSRKITEQFKHGKNFNTIKESKDEFVELTPMIDSITNILKCVNESEQKDIGFNDILTDINTVNNLITKIIQKLNEKTNENKKIHKQNEKIEDFNNERYHLGNLKQILLDTKLQINHSWLTANIATLLLTGDAGTGKTHLFCDVANNRFGNNHFGVLLHGGNFIAGNPKEQILKELGLSCTFEEFMGALDAVGQKSKSKTFIMIDALNEGDGQKIWPKYLAELLETISNYPWVSLAISVRTTYESLIIPKQIYSKLSKYTHKGFESKTEEALKIFFDDNGITRPSVPLLVPEFSNPQFLSVLCKGLKNEELTRIPKEIKGLTSVYEFFIDTVNDKLSKPEFLDYAHHEQIVQKAIEVLANLMSKEKTRYLRYDVAKEHMNQIHHSESYSKSLIHHMISEGILNQDNRRMEDGTAKQIIQFSYERLGDHLIVQNQLKNIQIKDISKLFMKNGEFAKYFKDESTLKQHRGIIDAISIQFPEKFSKELIEINPKFAQSSVLLESFIDSFMWRNSTSITESSLSQIDKHIIKKRHYLERFFEILVTISIDPKIILNAKYLHNYLQKLELGDRDYVWSTFLHNNYYKEDSIVRRYIDWAWRSEKSSIDTKSVYLAVLTLSWFLTSSNRFVRDQSTKALISLLSNNIEILEKLLPKFIKCNDLYVIERLFCVAYGCSMRNNNKTELKKLAQYTYTSIFKKGIPPTNILLRDYAKSIIDYVLSKKIKLDIDYVKVTPPYNSKWIKFFPAEETIKELEKNHQDTHQINNGASAIFYSLSHMGDFYRYILGGNSNSFEWFDIRLPPQNKSREEIFVEFQKSITKSQKTSWENYYTVNSSTHKPKNGEKLIKEYEKILRNKLDKNQLEIFDTYIVPYMNLAFHSKTPKKSFDLSVLSRWIIKRVFDLGWTRERFGRYDTAINGYWHTRNTHKPERMGKKYQWIAHSELLSRVCDNFEFGGESLNSQSFEKYIGSWQLSHCRDIDPSLLVSNMFSNSNYDKPYSSWWFPFNYNDWDSETDDVEWLKSTSDLPSFESIIDVADPTGTEWFVLGGYFSLPQKIPVDKDSLDIGKKQTYFHLGSCIAKKSNIEKLYTWGKKQGFHGTRFPRFDHAYDTFLGEFYWSNAAQHAIITGDPFWTNLGDSLETMPAKVYVTMYQYLHESGEYDCSTNDERSIFLPNKLLVDKMNLINKNNGTFVDSNDEIIACDPTISEIDPKVLLVRKDKFLEFLKDNNYGIIWHVIGEKRFVEGLSNLENCKGMLEIQGVYQIVDNKIKGTLNTQFVDRKLTDKRN